LAVIGEFIAPESRQECRGAETVPGASRCPLFPSHHQFLKAVYEMVET